MTGEFDRNTQFEIHDIETIYNNEDEIKTQSTAENSQDTLQDKVPDLEFTTQDFNVFRNDENATLNEISTYKGKEKKIQYNPQNKTSTTRMEGQTFRNGSVGNINNEAMSKPESDRMKTARQDGLIAKGSESTDQQLMIMNEITDSLLQENEVKGKKGSSEQDTSDSLFGADSKLKSANQQTSGNGPTKSKMKRRIPNIINFGFSKCGTRALLQFMGLHPEIAIANHEVNFFNKYYEKGVNWYVSEMPLAYGYQNIMEKSPEYVHDEKTPARIYKMNKTMKLILLLCDPVRRAVSEYVQGQMKREPENRRAFEDLAIWENSTVVNNNFYTIKRGRYSYYLKHWFEVFPLHRIHIVDGDKFRENPLPQMKAVENYLGLKSYFNDETFFFDKEKGFYCYKIDGNVTRCLGESKGRPHPQININVLNQVRNYFQPFNEELYKMIGRTFNW